MLLTNDEFASLIEEIEASVAARTGHEPGDGRTRHILSLVVVPDKSEMDPDPHRVAD
ncbi:hypothetical protein [Nonomuraea sp. NPDC049784]|uniref:hypothetical protein n=1 Tax=Nonomuraea sp. NPDC049784 TaxID=3154361 RepID=UPI00340286E5